MLAVAELTGVSVEFVAVERTFVVVVVVKIVELLVE